MTGDEPLLEVPNKSIGTLTELIDVLNPVSVTDGMLRPLDPPGIESVKELGNCG